MRKFILSALISTTLFAQDVTPKPRAISMIQHEHHSHKKLWLSIAAVAGTGLAVGLIESRQQPIAPHPAVLTNCQHIGHLETCVGR
jgi:hypothetical protein